MIISKSTLISFFLHPAGGTEQSNRSSGIRYSNNIPNSYHFWWWHLTFVQFKA